MSINSRFIDVLPIISASSGDRRTEPPLFDSSHRDGSNGGSLVLLPSFVAEIIGKTSMNQLFIDVLPIILASSGGKRLKPPPFDSLHRNGSNGGRFYFPSSFLA